MRTHCVQEERSEICVYVLYEWSLGNHITTHTNNVFYSDGLKTFTTNNSKGVVYERRILFLGVGGAGSWLGNEHSK